jgi:hypothetical protein
MLSGYWVRKVAMMKRVWRDGGKGEGEEGEPFPPTHTTNSDTQLYRSSDLSLGIF